MSKNTKPEIPADMWLHVAADALVRYVAGGGEMLTAVAPAADGGTSIYIILPVSLDDQRLPAAFVGLFSQSEPATQEATS